MINHYLLYGHGGCYNHGAEAITKTTMDVLRKISPQCHITLSTHFPEQDREFEVAPDVFAERNLKGVDNTEIYASTLKEICNDTIGIHVGGDNYCYKNWERYADIHYAIKRRGKKSILWGCSIEEGMLDDSLIRVLQTHDVIFAREEKTYKMLLRYGFGNVARVCDIAFTMKPKDTPLPKDPYICLNLSPLVCRINQDALPAIKELIAYIVNNTKLNIALVPHVTMPMDNDYALLETIYKELTEWKERIFLCSGHLSAAEYKYIISKSLVCVAARTHAVIAAYSSGVPAIAIAYSVKAEGIALDVGMEKYIMDINHITGKGLIDMVNEAIEKNDSLRADLKIRAEECQKLAYNDIVRNSLL